MSSQTVIGGMVEVVALVATPSIDIPTGVVIFKLGNRTLDVVSVNELGIAKLSISSDILGLGSHSIGIFYAGDANHRPSREIIVKTIIK